MRNEDGNAHVENIYLNQICVQCYLWINTAQL